MAEAAEGIGHRSRLLHMPEPPNPGHAGGSQAGVSLAIRQVRAAGMEERGRREPGQREEAVCALRTW